MTSDSTLYPDTSVTTPSSFGLWWRRFLIKLRSWEYWPVYVFNIPVVLIWIWTAIKARDFFFFTLTNPGIPTGGFFGESKSDILRHIPDHFKPKTVLLKPAALKTDLQTFFN